MQFEENHPFNVFSLPSSKVLIIGTFPPTKRNWSYEFFYPNKQNLFWRMMAQIAGKHLQYFSGVEAVEERKEIVSSLHVAITDMGLVVRRMGESSLDENLIAIEYMDILKILDQYPLIQKIILTSSSGRSSAAKWFLDYLKQKGIIHKFPIVQKPIHSEIEYKGRLIKIAVLYSPSPRAANRITFERLTEMYKKEILDK